MMLVGCCEVMCRLKMVLGVGFFSVFFLIISVVLFFLFLGGIFLVG